MWVDHSKGGMLEAGRRKSSRSTFTPLQPSQLPALESKDLKPVHQELRRLSELIEMIEDSVFNLRNLVTKHLKVVDCSFVDRFSACVRGYNRELVTMILSLWDITTGNSEKTLFSQKCVSQVTRKSLKEVAVEYKNTEGRNLVSSNESYLTQPLSTFFRNRTEEILDSNHKNRVIIPLKTRSTQDFHKISKNSEFLSPLHIVRELFNECVINKSEKGVLKQMIIEDLITREDFSSLSVPQAKKLMVERLRTRLCTQNTCTNTFTSPNPH